MLGPHAQGVVGQWGGAMQWCRGLCRDVVGWKRAKIYDALLNKAHNPSLVTREGGANISKNNQSTKQQQIARQWALPRCSRMEAC